MRLFSFSGVAFGFTDNPGTDHKDFCLKIRDSLPPTSFNGVSAIYNNNMASSADHFPSHISLDDYFDELLDAIRLEAAKRLDTESRAYAPLIAAQILKLTSAAPTEEVLLVAHSQGCNNATFTLRYLHDYHPEFFTQRSVRCAMFDPKVASSNVDSLFSLLTKDKLRFLFSQSENDLLTNQDVFRSKFINQFELGDHIWVKRLTHGSIHKWDVLGEEQKYMLRADYVIYQQEWKKKVKRLQQEMRGGQMGPMQLHELDKWKNKYPMSVSKAEKKTNPTRHSDLVKGLLDFLQGKNPSILTA